VKCPKCGVLIFYGYPTRDSMDDLLEAVDRGEVELGGCCIREENFCPRCGALVFESKGKA
jgi:ribosomal protein S27AE